MSHNLYVRARFICPRDDVSLSQPPRDASSLSARGQSRKSKRAVLSRDASRAAGFFPPPLSSPPKPLVNLLCVPNVPVSRPRCLFGLRVSAQTEMIATRLLIQGLDDPESISERHKRDQIHKVVGLINGGRSALHCHCHQVGMMIPSFGAHYSSSRREGVN